VSTRAIQQSMQWKKLSSEAVMSKLVISASYSYLSKLLPKSLQDFFGLHYDALLSTFHHTMGVEQNALLLAGNLVNSITTLERLPAEESLGCSIYIYNGKVSISAQMDLDNFCNVKCNGMAQRLCDLFAEVIEEKSWI
jgi:hypothetical protein